MFIAASSGVAFGRMWGCCLQVAQITGGHTKAQFPCLGSGQLWTTTPVPERLVGLAGALVMTALQFKFSLFPSCSSGPLQMLMLTAFPNKLPALSECTPRGPQPTTGAPLAFIDPLSQPDTLSHQPRGPPGCCTNYTVMCSSSFWLMFALISSLLNSKGSTLRLPLNPTAASQTPVIFSFCMYFGFSNQLWLRDRILRWSLWPTERSSSQWYQMGEKLNPNAT